MGLSIITIGSIETFDGDKNDMRHEYTEDCGWIDWFHANPDRKDIKLIWESLPPKSNRTKPDVRIVNKSTGTTHSYWEVPVLFLDGTEEYGRETWYVRDVGNATAPWAIWYYKKAALSLFEMSCEKVEGEEQWDIGSAWAMEDMVSNLMAFHGYMMAWDDGVNVDDENKREPIKRKIIDKCGGWKNMKKAKKKSLEVCKELYDHYTSWIDGFPNFDQPDTDAAKGFKKAYLYNNLLSKNLTTDNRGEDWYSIPSDFLTYWPLPNRYELTNGSDILSPGNFYWLSQTHKIISSNTQNQSYFLNDRMAQTVSPGLRMARAPVPYGREGFA